MAIYVVSRRMGVVARQGDAAPGRSAVPRRAGRSPDAVLERSADAIAAEWDIEVARSIDVGPEVVLEPELLVLMYRTVCEALRNAAKHADATTYSLAASHEDGWLVVTVRDDGRGFTPAITARDRLVPEVGTGFNLLLEHVRASGGTTLLASEPGSGTAVEIRLPC